MTLVTRGTVQHYNMLLQAALGNRELSLTSRKRFATHSKYPTKLLQLTVIAVPINVFPHPHPWDE